MKIFKIFQEIEKIRVAHSPNLEISLSTKEVKIWPRQSIAKFGSYATEFYPEYYVKYSNCITLPLDTEE